MAYGKVPKKPQQCLWYYLRWIFNLIYPLVSCTCNIFMTWIYYKNALNIAMAQGHLEATAYPKVYCAKAERNFACIPISNVSQELDNVAATASPRYMHAHTHIHSKKVKVKSCNVMRKVTPACHSTFGSNLFRYFPGTSDRTEIARSHQHRPVDDMKAHFQLLVLLSYG